MNNKIPLQSIVLLIILSCIWGSSFILMKKGLEVYSFSQVASLRIFISGLAFLPLLIRKLKLVKSKKYKYMLLFGILNGGFPPFLFTKAQTEISSAMAGILNSLTPLFTLIIGIIIFRSQFAMSKLLGVLMGLLGAILLIAFNNGNSINLTDPSNLYGLFVVAATICYALSTHIIKNFLQDVPALTIAGLSYITLAIPLGLYLFSTDFTTVLFSKQGSWEALGYISILAILGTAIALVLFGKVIQQSNALFGSFVTYLIPFIAIFWGVLDGEMLTSWQYLGMITILVGIFIANAGQYKRFFFKKSK